MNWDAIIAVLTQVEKDTIGKIDTYKAGLPAEAVPAVQAVEAIIEDAFNSALPTLRDVLVQQFKEQLLAGHGPVAKSGVDLA